MGFSLQKGFHFFFLFRGKKNIFPHPFPRRISTFRGGDFGRDFFYVIFEVFSPGMFFFSRKSFVEGDFFWEGVVGVSTFVRIHYVRSDILNRYSDKLTFCRCPK